MSDKRKFHIHPHYASIVGCVLFGILNWFLTPSPHTYYWHRETTVCFVITMLLHEGRHYTFSEKGIKAYMLGIRIRNVPWSSVKRLIHIDDRTAARKDHHGEFLVVEKLSCDSLLPEEANAWKARVFFLMNLTGAFKIRLSASKCKAQVEEIEQFHEIDDYFIWERD